MSQSNMEVVVTAKDEASAKLKEIGQQAKTLGEGFAVAGGVMVGALALTVKASADAQEKMGQFDVMLKNVKNTTVTTSENMNVTSTSLKLVGTSAEIVKNQIKNAELAIKAKQESLTKLNQELYKGKITQAEYSSSVAQTKNDIEGLQLKVKDYNERLLETETSVKKVTVEHSKQLTVVAGAREALLKVADATLKLGFDNEESALSLAKFYSRTLSVTEATKLNVVAMDLARQKNIDLTTATTLVNQVLSGNGKVLKQYGIDIKESASPLEALNELHEKTKGSAEAYAQSFVGQQEVMKQALGELEENIGSQLLPLLTDFAKKATVVLNNIKAWTDAHPELTKKIVLIVAVVGSFLLVLAPLMIMLPAIIGFFTALASPVGIIIGIFLFLALSVKNVVEIFELFRDHSKEVWEGVKIIFSDAINAIVGWFQPLINVLDSILDKIRAVGSGVGNAIGKTVSSAGSAISGAYTSVANFVTGKKASGGNVLGGDSYLVGENGAEIFTPSGSGYITSNSNAGGGRSIIVNINGGTYLSHEVAEQIGNMIIKNVQRVARI